MSGIFFIHVTYMRIHVRGEGAALPSKYIPLQVNSPGAF